jgi:predicted ATPase
MDVEQNPVAFGDAIAQVRVAVAAVDSAVCVSVEPIMPNLNGLTPSLSSSFRPKPSAERWWEAEVSRLQGDLRLQLPAPEVHQAEACFQQALTVACGQQARSLELRAALSLSRLWQQQGKQEAAHDLLASIYSWFTEGLDTGDLQDAKELLEELS